MDEADYLSSHPPSLYPSGRALLAGKLANQPALPSQLPILFKGDQRQSDEIQSWGVSEIIGKGKPFPPENYFIDKYYS